MNEFLNILPTDCKDFPVFYNDEELTYLKGTTMLDMIVKKKWNI